MAHGPLQVLVLNFEHANFSGEIQAELSRLEDAGVLHVLDLLFVSKSPEGEITLGEAGDIHTGSLGQAILGDGSAPEPRPDDDVWYAADAIEPGSAAAVAVVEHTWAIPLRDAVQRAGGRQTAAEWIDESQLAALGVTLP
jgi:hypothetical protein